MSPIATIIGANVRDARRMSAMTQAQLAERVSRSVETISNLERGNLSPPQKPSSPLPPPAAAPRHAPHGWPQERRPPRALIRVAPRLARPEAPSARQ